MCGHGEAVPAWLGLMAVKLSLLHRFLFPLKAVVLAKETVPVEMPPLAATTEVFPHRVATCVEKRILQPSSPAEASRGRDCASVLGESSKAIPAATPPLGRDGEKRDWSKDDVALEAAADGEWLEPTGVPRLVWLGRTCLQGG